MTQKAQILAVTINIAPASFNIFAFFSPPGKTVAWQLRSTRTCQRPASRGQSPTQRWWWRDAGSRNWRNACRSLWAATEGPTQVSSPPKWKLKKQKAKYKLHHLKWDCWPLISISVKEKNFPECHRQEPFLCIAFSCSLLLAMLTLHFWKVQELFFLMLLLHWLKKKCHVYYLYRFTLSFIIHDEVFDGLLLLAKIKWWILDAVDTMWNNTTKQIFLTFFRPWRSTRHREKHWSIAALSQRNDIMQLCTSASGMAPRHSSRDGASSSYLADVMRTTEKIWGGTLKNPSSLLLFIQCDKVAELWEGLQQTAGWKCSAAIIAFSFLYTKRYVHRQKLDIFSSPNKIQAKLKTVSLDSSPRTVFVLADRLPHVVGGSIRQTCLQTLKDISCFSKWNVLAVFSWWLRRRLIALPDRQMDRWTDSKKSF